MKVIFDEMSITVILLKHSSETFKELDEDKDGFINGNELNTFAEWLLKNSMAGSYQPSVAEIINEKERLMRRFGKTPNDILTMNEMSILCEETNVSTATSL